MTAPFRDFRYAFRLLGKSRTFTVTAVLTLALCIGANTAIFSVVNAVLFRPLPYPDPERLASVATLRRGGGGEYEQTRQDGRTWELVRDHAKAIDAAVFGGASGVNFVAESGAQYVNQQRVSAGFFRVLGTSPLIGREFTAQEDRVGGPPVAVLSNALWRRAFRSDPSVIGKKIELRGEPYTVIGLMPTGFETNEPADVWTPLRPSTSGEGSGINYQIVARLRPGVSWAQADSEIGAVGQSFIEQWHLPPGQTARLHLMPLQTSLTEDIRKPLLILWAAVGLVLLIGCVNIAGLLLARSGARRREIAVRMALGSNRGAVIRQLFAESLVLAVAGGVTGMLLGYVALQELKVLAADTLGVSQTNVALDARVLIVTGLTAVLASFLFGLYPAIQTTRVDIQSALAQGGSRGTRGASRSWTRRVLVVAEVALGAVLLIGAGLLIRTLVHLNGLPPGFDAANVMTASLSLQDARYATAQKVNRLFEESLQRIRQTPGVEAAGAGLTLPYERALNDGFIRLDGPHVSGQFEITNVTYVTAGYFEALRMRLLRGRLLTPGDRDASQPVAIVNEAFARKYLPEQEAVGSHIKTVEADREIVGVIGDVQQAAGWGDFGPHGAVPGVYVPAAQVNDKYFQLVHTWFSPSWVVRTSAPHQSVIAELERAVAAVDPRLPFAEFRTMDEVRGHSVAFQRLNASLLGVLAGLALLLATLGIYGLIANAVVERTREFGIRMALGCTVSQAVQAVSIPGISLALIGLTIGCTLALGATRILRTLIWGVEPTDVLTFGTVCGAMLLVAALASLVPSLRVARISPAQTLREE